jgi:hypothetical protein
MKAALPLGRRSTAFRATLVGKRSKLRKSSHALLLRNLTAVGPSVDLPEGSLQFFGTCRTHNRDFPDETYG